MIILFATCLLTALLAQPAGAETVLDAELTFAPGVPAPVGKRGPATVRATLDTPETIGTLMEGFESGTQYVFWTFNGRVPGPMIRVREGDTLELTLKNPADSRMAHNIDLHAVTGPGGGAAITLVKPGESKTVRLKMRHAGLYVYHCAAPPVTDHIANGMYGLILVEPAKGLPRAEREFYVMQSEFYTKEELGHEGLVSYDREAALREDPTYVVFNGRHGALLEGGALRAKVGETVRLYVGNAGPNKVSSFHVIGEIFDRVYDQASLTGAPKTDVQTTLVPAGGAAVVEFGLEVPGNYTLVDHSIFRLEKGAVGLLSVEGPESPEIYSEKK